MEEEEVVVVKGEAARGPGPREDDKRCEHLQRHTKL